MNEKTFLIELALMLRTTVAELLKMMTAADLAAWMVYRNTR